MKITIGLMLLILMISFSVDASIFSDTTFVEKNIILKTKTGDIFGTLTTPASFNKIPVALIIVGSGPMDRDGNYIPLGIKGNCYKMLSNELLKHGIATLRYDKRGIAESQAACKNEIDLRFDDLMEDAKGLVQMLKQDKRFSKVIVIGHSEGSLIGMPAAVLADKYISLAGSGQSVDKLLKTQLSVQPKYVTAMAFPILDSLVKGRTVTNVDPMLNSLFKASLQPYLISWIKFDPQVEISKLKIPVLILQGTSDLNITVEDAKRLSVANPKANLVLIENMNHVFRIVGNDMQANVKSYSDASLPISDILVKSITDFILKN